MSSKHVTKAPLGSPFLAGVVTAALWLAAGALLLSLLLRYGGLQESDLPVSAMIAHGVAALAGGFAAGKSSGHKGWYYGSILGFFYASIILLIGFLAADGGLSARSALLVGVTILSGAFGGMVGVNLHK
ncbi:TIGR04086 family membrane protein [Paenibacillus cisolokensis]|uniref:TIGR04086 family membrane protein n=1 Tax=Paenibacillus cisolokensis TaxID=1658519 RepID=UPI003D270000